MGNLWMKFKIWSKIILLAVIVIYLGIFAFQNASENVQIWVWFGPKTQTNVLVLILVTMIFGIVGTLLFRTIRTTVRQLSSANNAKRITQLEQEISSRKSKASMLQTKPLPGSSPPPPESL